jgi:hypothetical protein
VRDDATIACWGDGSQGQTDAPPGTFTDVAAGGAHTCAVGTDGGLTCWGDDDLGQSTPPEGTFVDVEAAGDHSCAIDADGALACWSPRYEWVPGIEPPAPPAGSYASLHSTEAGADFCAVHTDGSLRCWAGMSITGWLYPID